MAYEPTLIFCKFFILFWFSENFLSSLMGDSQRRSSWRSLFLQSSSAMLRLKWYLQVLFNDERDVNIPTLAPQRVKQWNRRLLKHVRFLEGFRAHRYAKAGSSWQSVILEYIEQTCQQSSRSAGLIPNQAYKSLQ
jgi:hypothetical protein